MSRTLLSRPVAASLLAALLAATGLALAGCEHRLVEDTIFDTEYLARNLPNEEKVLRDSWFEPRAPGAVQSYCYRSLGAVECYPHPQKDEGYRLNGFFGPAPE